MNNSSILTTLLVITAIGQAHAQTSGPSTPEVQQFTPANVNNLVDLFTGRLNYNIPLLQLDGGYPINISYASGANMNEEAGCIGLGWQLNIGRINRTVRGLPDDFKSDRITRQLKQQDEWNIGIGVGIDAEIFGFGVGAETGLSFSNMRGVDVENSLSAAIGPKIGDLSLSAGLKLGMSTNEGATISPNVGLRYRDFSMGMRGTISAMEGVKYSGFTASFQREGNSKLAATFPLAMARSPFIPKIDFPVTNLSGSFKIRFGPEMWGVSTGGVVYGQFTKQSYQDQERNLEAYGYLYLQHMKQRNAIMDIGTEKEGPVYTEDKNLSISYLANDVFSVSAQGLTGTFRPFRKDIGINHYESVQANDAGGSLGVETHGGAYYHAGFDVTANIVNNYSGQWENTSLAGDLNFKKSPETIPVYFRNMGEPTVFANSDILNNKLGGMEPIAFEIGESVILPNQQIKTTGTTKQTESSNYAFQYLTATEADMARMPMNSYNRNGNRSDTLPIPRNQGLDGVRKPHHISVITITKDDGTVYEFGIAAYNTAQKEYMFNIPGHDGQHLFVPFTGFDIGDNTMGNSNGRANYFSCTETAPYAYAYLLTAVYSPDYIDLTGDGPTSDDFGTYTRFNYTRETDSFKWHTPAPADHNATGQHLANYDPGHLCDQQDDIASYVTGKKEIWMIHSIETKNYIAQCYTSPRKDAREQSLDNNTQSLTRIDSIRLFARSEYNSYGESATPVQSVYFSYNTSLCENIPANPQGSGKLTLKKLAFSYGRSKKEKHSYYSFDYYNENNPAFAYKPGNTDTWGNYKKDNAGKFNNTRFPYSEQNAAKANKEANGWNLKAVHLPTGGNIEIAYEANDYAFVQDKPAMQMYKIIGFGKRDSDMPGNILYDNSPNYWMFVAVDSNITNSSLYCRNGESIYINAIVKAGDNANIDKEQISGYFNMRSQKLIAPGKLAIELEPANGNTQPIARAFWQKMRKDLSHIMHPPVIDPKRPPMDNILSVVKNVPLAGVSFLEFLRNYASVMQGQHRAETLDTDYGSFVRLYNPIGKKLGGGSRVKEIRISDNWNWMTNNAASEAVYGKTYTYTTINGQDTISSGVATYEPIGNQENPFIVSTGEFNNAHALAPELYYYKTEPFGESFFPAPSIGYSRIVIADLQNRAVQKHSTGFEIQEYYTSRDFPVITRRTAKTGIPSVRASVFSNQQKYTASQGFLIELNDMNGRLKAQKVYSKNDSLNPVSGVEYRYRTAAARLNNNVPVINPADGVISQDRQAGIDYDFYIATTESSSLSKSPAVQVNLDVIPVVFGIPFPVPVVLPSYAESLTQYKGITTTKVIYRTGLIDEVITYENGGERSAKNLLYDKCTGQVVVRAIQTEYHKPQYKTTLPAWWWYPGMGPASLNTNTFFTDIKNTSINTPAFHEADVLLLWKDGNIARKAWVYKNRSNQQSLIDEAGQPVDKSLFTYAKIISSGLKNRQALTGADILSAVNPIVQEKLQFKDSTSIINASANEFSQYWQGYYSVHPPRKIVTCACKEQLNQLREMIPRIDFNTDGTISKPGNVSLNGNLLTIKRVSNQSNCRINIRLDRKWERIKLDSAFLKLTIDNAVPGEGFCENSYAATGHYTISKYMPGGPVVLATGTFDLDNDCTPTTNCKTSTTTVSDESCVLPINETINPYLLGILGSWRQTATHQYLTTRKYDAKALQEKQGFFAAFDLFSAPSAGFFSATVAPEKWKTSDSAVVYDPHGQPVEALDALSIPNARLYGYRYSFPVATATRATYDEIAADGFEDYDFAERMKDPLTQCPLPAHFKPDSISGQVLVAPGDSLSGIVESNSHTGVRSLLVVAQHPVQYRRKIDNGCRFYQRSLSTDDRYRVQSCDIIKPFSPTPGKQYLFSCWINEKRDVEQLDSSRGNITITFFDAGHTPINQPVVIRSGGPIIDNWQKASALFQVPASADSVVIRFSVPPLTTMLVDDVRLQPAASRMKTYVYDPVRLRLMAMLDEDNFSTFYEYDGEGQLCRTKKETGQGIFSIDEIRSAKSKHP